MSNVVELVIDDQVVYFEIGDDSDDHFETLSPSPKEVGKKVLGSFQAALDTIKTVATSMVRQVQKFDKAIAPDEFQMEFGIKLSSEYGAVVTKTCGEAQITVSLTYKHDKS